MSQTDRLLEEIVEELRHLRADLGIVQGDLNAIRNGEYEAPQGVDRTVQAPARKSGDDGPREFVTSREW